MLVKQNGNKIERKEYHTEKARKIELCNRNISI